MFEKAYLYHLHDIQARRIYTCSSSSPHISLSSVANASTSSMMMCTILSLNRSKRGWLLIASHVKGFRRPCVCVRRGKLSSCTRSEGKRRRAKSLRYYKPCCGCGSIPLRISCRLPNPTRSTGSQGHPRQTPTLCGVYREIARQDQCLLHFNGLPIGFIWSLPVRYGQSWQASAEFYNESEV